MSCSEHAIGNQHPSTWDLEIAFVETYVQSRVSGSGDFAQRTGSTDLLQFRLLRDRVTEFLGESLLESD